MNTNLMFISPGAISSLMGDIFNFIGELYKRGLCVLNVRTAGEAVLIGFITLVLGKIAFSLVLTTEEDKKKKEKEHKHLELILFLAGFFLHFIIEMIGLNKWYCDKKCLV
jgi:uncharacterized membrane protein